MVNDVPTSAHIDTEAQCSTICRSFSKQLDPEIWPLNMIIRLKGDWRVNHSMLGCL